MTAAYYIPIPWCLLTLEQTASGFAITAGRPKATTDANLRELNGQLMEVPTSHPSAYGSGSKSYGHSWRSKRNETLNTYVIEIAI
jgi:hypothetical protein